MYQLITPNPDIPCKPGWCLEYVNNAFDVPAVYGSATDAWNGSSTQHQDRDFPSGVWLPVWYGLANEPLGHVVLRAPDGSVYSTSDLTNVPHHHSSLADLEAYYAYYGMTLTYRGWTEDVEGTPVVAAGDTGTIAVEGTITPQSTTTTPVVTVSEEDFMGGTIDAQQAEDIVQAVVSRVIAALDGKVKINAVQAESIVQATTSRTTAAVDALNTGKTIDRGQADDIARAAAAYGKES